MLIYDLYYTKRPKYLDLGYFTFNCGHWTKKSSVILYNMQPDRDRVCTRQRLSMKTIRIWQIPRKRNNKAAKQTGTHVPGPLVRISDGRWRATTKTLKIRAHNAVQAEEIQDCPTSRVRGTTSTTNWSSPPQLTFTRKEKKIQIKFWTHMDEKPVFFETFFGVHNIRGNSPKCPS